MTFKYEDETGSELEIKMPHRTGLIVGIMGDTGEYTNIIVKNADAPRVALEILKAAGHPPLETGGFHTAGTNGHLGAIAQELQDAIKINEKLEEAERRDERRDELARELSDASDATYANRSATAQAAIDRIIELEQVQP